MAKTAKSPEVIVAGHLCLDLSPAFGAGSSTMQDIFVPGKLVNVGQAAMSTGGAVSNTGLTLRMLGISCGLMGKIGQDLFGSIVEQILQRYAASGSLIVDQDSDTSYSIVLAPPGIDRMFLHHPGANDTFAAEDLNLDLLQQARLCHFGYPPLMRRLYSKGGSELVLLFKKLRELGLTTSLDLALPDPASEAGQANWLKILADVLPLVDIFVPSLEELLFMLDRPCFEGLKAKAGKADILDFYDYSQLPGLADRVLGLGVKILVIKLGTRGFYVRTKAAADLLDMGRAAPENLAAWADREIWSPVFDVPKEKIASTSGAGDASIAGFLAGLVAGDTAPLAAELACAVAGLKIQSPSSVGEIAPLAEVKMIMADWAKEELDLARDYWHYSADSRLWFGKRDHSHPHYPKK
jgi:sugar/nucleoside kinase (ribokinase family)